MGVHPSEVLKQIMQMNNNEGEEQEQMDDEEEDMEGEEDPYDQEEEEEQSVVDKYGEEQLRREKEAFKAQMTGSKPQNAPAAPASDKKVMKNEPIQQHYQYQDEEYDDEDEEGAESYYSEGEIKTRIKLISQKSYSAPYIVFSDCY